jgi:hypothetical protein
MTWEQTCAGAGRLQAPGATQYAYLALQHSVLHGIQHAAYITRLHQAHMRYLLTIQVISMVCHSVEVQRCSSPFLIVCPASVLSNWATELRHWAPDLVVVQYRGSADAREEIYKKQVGCDLSNCIKACMHVQMALSVLRGSC